MRREVLQRDLGLAADELLERGIGKDGFECRHLLAPLGHHLVVEVVLLAARIRAERDELLDARRERAEAAAALARAGEARRRDRRLRLRDDLVERDEVAFTLFCEFREIREAGCAFHFFPCADGDGAIRRRREREHSFAGVPCREERRHAFCDTRVVFDDAEFFLEVRVFLRERPCAAFRARAMVADIRAERALALCKRLIVARDGDELRHRLAGDRLALAAAPVADFALRLCELALRVMLDRHGDEVFIRLHVDFFREFRHGFAERHEDIPVALDVPRAIDGRLERMDEWMHIRRREVVFLIPCRRRQHDVGVERRACHAEIEVDEEVELADARLVAPLDLLRLLLAFFFFEQAVLRAEQVFQEIFVAFRRRCDEVCAPDEEVAREVLGRIRVFDSKVQLLVLELLRDEFFHRVNIRAARSFRGVADGLAALVERRVARQPAEARGEYVVVAGVAVARVLHERRDELVVIDLLRAPLIRREVEERRGVLQAGRLLPVTPRHDGLPAFDGAEFFLTDVVRPAAAVLAFAAREHEEVQHRAIDDIGVVPMIDAAAHDDHGTAVRLDGVVGELARRADDELRRETRVALLPSWRVRRVVFVRRRCFAAKAAVDAVVRHDEVKDRRAFHGAVLRLDDFDGDGTRDRAILAFVAEVREREHGRVVIVINKRQARVDGSARVAVFLAQVPFRFVAPAVAERAVRHDELVCFFIEHIILEGRVLVRASEIRAVEQAAGHELAVFLLDAHEERHIRVFLRVVDEFGGRRAEVIFAQDDVAHGHGERAVASGFEVQPRVGSRRRLSVVRRDGDDLRALVAHFREEMRVRRARQRHVRAPRDDVAGVVPVARLWRIRLVAPDLRACGRQIGVPIIEAQRCAAHHVDEARASRVAQHRHRRDDGEAEVAVRAVFLHGVEERGRDELADLVPRRAHEAAHAARLLVRARLFWIFRDRLPRFERVLRLRARFAPEADEFAAHVRILHAQRAVEIPRERRAARAAARFEVRHVRVRLRVVVVLVFPRDEAVFDEDVPAARARAVHAVRRAHSLVIRPAAAVEIFPAASAFLRFRTSVRRLLDGAHVAELFPQMMHGQPSYEDWMVSKMASKLTRYCSSPRRSPRTRSLLRARRGRE